MNEPPPTPSASQRLANQLADSAIVEQEVIRARRIAVAPATVTRQRTAGIALAVAVPILVAVLLGTFFWEPLVSLFETTPPAAEAARQAQETLNGLVAGIDSFHKDYHHLPATLVEVGVPPRGRWIYTSTDAGQYTIAGVLYGKAVAFDSARAPAPPAKERP
jgi:hypothetical protein